MKQVQVHKYGGPEVLKIVEAAMPVIEGWEMLVQVKYASANPKDVLLRKGKLKAFLSIAFPLTLGQDFSGVVVQAGKKIKEYKPGDKIYGMTNRPNNGTFSEYIKVSPQEVCHLPENMDFAEAAAVPLTAQTALQALKDIAKIKPGQHVCINGASGGVGTFAIQIAKILGAKVTAVSSAKNEDICRRLGADIHLDYNTISVEKSNAKYDVFFDVFGNKNWRKTKHLLPNNGWYISTAPNAKNIGDTILSYLKIKNSRLIVVESDYNDLKTLKGWLEKGKLKPVIEKEYPLSEIKEVHKRLETKRVVGKIVLRVS
ncbi:MAG TPA: NAD(P)-dependent alcohol dehydrogenase [Bacteroidetes bacterium]|nr:NAD(P)-dependent alcohol dehydrogenase [Bacteroidota bacterium]